MGELDPGYWLLGSELGVQRRGLKPRGSIEGVTVHFAHYCPLPIGAIIELFPVD
jgi:hypothetical protein